MTLLPRCSTSFERTRSAKNLSPSFLAHVFGLKCNWPNLFNEGFGKASPISSHLSAVKVENNAHKSTNHQGSQARNNNMINLLELQCTNCIHEHPHNNTVQRRPSFSKAECNSKHAALTMGRGYKQVLARRATHRSVQFVMRTVSNAAQGLRVR